MNKHTIEVIYRVQRFIDENPFDNQSITQLAKAAGMSRKTLQKNFKAIIGMQITKYRLAKRMEEARVMLEGNNKPVKEIAFLCRYKSHRAFTSAFKKHFGLAPTVYQKKFLSL